MAALTEPAPSIAEDDVSLTVFVSSETLERLERERNALRDGDLRTTLRNRLEAASRRLAVLDYADLLWPPPRRDQHALEICVSKKTQAELDLQANRFGIESRLLVTGVLTDELFDSPLLALDRHNTPSGYLRTERGRGRIYGMTFEVTGYQYAFLKVVGGRELLPTDVFEWAVRSLAERIARNDVPANFSLTRDAFMMASEIVLRARHGERARQTEGRDTPYRRL